MGWEYTQHDGITKGKAKFLKAIVAQEIDDKRDSDRLEDVAEKIKHRITDNSVVILMENTSDWGCSNDLAEDKCFQGIYNDIDVLIYLW